jgi:hypothetical protein
MIMLLALFTVAMMIALMRGIMYRRIPYLMAASFIVLFSVISGYFLYKGDTIGITCFSSIMIVSISIPTFLGGKLLQIWSKKKIRSNKVVI